MRRTDRQEMQMRIAGDDERPAAVYDRREVTDHSQVQFDREIWRKFEGRAPIGYCPSVRIASNSLIPPRIRIGRELARPKI